MKKTVLFLLLTLCTLTLSAQESKMFRKGYRGSIEIGNYAVFGKDKFGGIAQMTLSQGYSFGNGAYIGLGFGAGVDLSGSFYVPLFMDAKYNFINGQISPFASVRTGLRVSGLPSALSYNIALGGGVDFGRFSIKLGYEYSAARTRAYDDRAYIEYDVFSKPSALFCSFAVSF